MHSYSALFPLFAVSLLDGTPVLSNSPHSPYTQLKVLTEDVNSLKGALEKIKSTNEVPENLLTENKQLAYRIAQLESENAKLQIQLADLCESYKRQTQDLLDLSNDFQQLRASTDEINSNNVKSSDLVSFEKDISQIKESLNSTQNEMGNFEKKLADDGAKSSQYVQEQLQRVKSELLAFCQATNKKLQDFSEATNQKLKDFSEQTKQKVARSVHVKHTITSGESLASIARRYQTTPDQILSTNHLHDTRSLHVGDVIDVVIP